MENSSPLKSLKSSVVRKDASNYRDAMVLGSPTELVVSEVEVHIMNARVIEP